MPLPKCFTKLPISLSVLFCLVTYCSACENDIGISNNSAPNLEELGGSDSFLCRMCGMNTGDQSLFIDVSSPLCKSVRNETVHHIVSGKHIASTLTVQKLENPAGIVFDVITLRHSSCKGVGKWISESSWFPGYSWKPCLCSRCGQHLGWMFELNSAVEENQPAKPTATGFYGIISKNLLTETFAQTLPYTPKLFRD